MTDVFQVAASVSRALSGAGIRHAIIGGIALQAWGEPRVTRDVDVSALVGFGDEATKVRAMLDLFAPRIADAFEQSMQNRVLLCKSPEGIGIDIGLAAFPFEEAAMDRSALHEFLPGVSLPIISAEDLVTMKVFAGRPQDWIDVRGILVRQGGRIDWDLIEEPERMDRLLPLQDEASKL